MEKRIGERGRFGPMGHPKSVPETRLRELQELAKVAGQIVQATASGGLLELGSFTSPKVASEELIAHTLRISAQYVLGYWQGFAREDSVAARMLAENVHIPIIRTISLGQGKTRDIVEILSVAEYLRRGASSAGQLASREARTADIEE